MDTCPLYKLIGVFVIAKVVSLSYILRLKRIFFNFNTKTFFHAQTPYTLLI